MKKVILCILVSCLAALSSINAQTSQGKFLVGSSTTIGFLGTTNEFMNLGFTTEKSKDDDNADENPVKMINFNLQPKAGYFVMDNLAVGLDVFLYYQRYKSEDSDSKSRSTVFIAGPFVRYYSSTGVVRPFFEATGSMGKLINKDDYPWGEDKYTERVISASGRAGIAVSLGERVLFETSFLYNYMNMKPTENNDNNHRAIYNTFGINIGFIVLL